MEAANISLNGAPFRVLTHDQDVDQLCHVLRTLSSCLLQVKRSDEVCLDISADANGATVFYLDIKRGVKLVSAMPSCSDTTLVRMVIDAVPDLDAEVERQHLIPLEDSLVILRRFLQQEELPGMVPWP